MRAKCTISFHANEYIEYHLKPDTWEVGFDHDNQLNDIARQRIAERLGVAMSLVTLSEPLADCSPVLLDGEYVGEVSFEIDEE